jgi:hypothetical protein
VSTSAVGKQAKCAKCGKQFAVEASAVGGPVPAAASTASANSTSAKSATKPCAQQAEVPRSNRKSQAAAQPAASASPPVPTAAKTRSPLTKQELLAAFREPLPRSSPSFAYRAGILITALTMIVLPLIYLAFIALIGFGVYYHAVHNTAIVGMGTGRARVFSVLLYAAPLVAGPIAVFFMFKPLLARPSRMERSRSLTRQSEPLLFGFVDRICDEVGAARPRRIDVDCNVNASAGFRRGVLSMLGNDLVLTIGLPLAAGLSLQEFGGVLAHELGHFSQGMGMRLSYIVRSIVDWFVRVVYQRDQWDEWLESAAGELDIRIGWILLVAQLFVAIGRGLLWVLLHIGLAISGIMLRQMEFDADRYETRFAGSKSFGNTVRKLHLLNAAFGVSQQQLSASLDTRQLVDNLPGLIRYHAQHMAKDALPHIEATIQLSKTVWHESHPCDKDRVAAAERLNATGIFHSQRPASDLFNDFAAQAAATTWDLYLGVFGPKVPRTALQPLAQYVVEHGAKAPK